MSKSLRGKIKAPRKLLPQIDSWDKSWAILQQAIRQIFRKNASELSFEELYRNAYTLVLHKQGEKLYNGVREEINLRLDSVVSETIEPCLARYTSRSESAGTDRLSLLESGNALLQSIRAAWEDQVLCMSMIKDVLKYMDKVYSKQAGESQIYDCGLDLFRDRVILHDNHTIGSAMVKVIVGQVDFERMGDTISRSSAKSCLDMLQTLSDPNNAQSVYDQIFHGALIEGSSKFYLKEAAGTVGDMTAHEYLVKCKTRLGEENERSQSYLGFNITASLIAVVEKHMLKEHLHDILYKSSGLVFFLENDKVVELDLMYSLLGSVDENYAELKKGVFDQIAASGRAINASHLNESELKVEPDKSQGPAIALHWVQEVINLKEKYDHINEAGFRGSHELSISIANAFVSFINEMEKSPEFVSLFIDEHLKKGLKGKSEVEVEKVLDQTIKLFRYIKDKDHFEQYFKSHLAKRLLHKRSVSDDAERSMIAKLRLEVGNVFTSKLEGMFTDMRLSSDITREYKNNFQASLDDSQAAKSFDLSVSVLTETFWPVSLTGDKGATCIFPQEIEQVMNSFKNFYLARHSGRKLSWHPGMGTADVRVRFKKRTHEFNVSTYALAVLLLFEAVPSGQSVGFETIKTATAIPDTDLKRTLQSVACAKYKVLVKEPKGREINQNDKFYFNEDFSSPLARIKIATVAGNKVESAQERKVTMDKMDESRKHQMEACIVRVMKDRKVLDHNNLVSEVTKQLSSRFLPDPIMIKKRIEGLMEREYLQRQSDDRRMYEYLA